jgi:transmembrane sensor
VSDLDTRLARGPLRVRSLWSEGTSESLARRILRRRRFFFALDLAAVCASIAVILALSGGWRSLRGGASAAAPVAMTATVFSDGSVAELSSRETQLQVEQDTGTRMVSRLTGGARFKVVPNHERTFEVRAGDVRVRVLGTTFSVQQLPSGQTQVLVEHGRVEVAWLGGVALLESGQGGAFPPATEEPELPDAAAAQVETSSPPAIAHETPRSPSGGGWREHARAGDYGAAYDELNAKGRDPVRDETEDLMLAADVARLSAHPEDAVKPLRRVCDRHSSDKRAPVAAFTLGRVLLDDLGRAAEAAAAFRKARLLWPVGPLAEDGLAREADAWDRAGRPEQARAAASEYVGRYPQGRHADRMRKILAR